MHWTICLLGALMVLLGAVWGLQGMNVLGGSRMSGDPFWGAVGVMLLIAGLVVGFLGLRQARRSRGA